MEGSTSSKATTSIQKSVTGKKRKQMRSGNVDAQPASQPKESQETKQKGSSVIDSIFEKRPVKPPSMSTNAALVPDAAAPRQDGQVRQLCFLACSDTCASSQLGFAQNCLSKAHSTVACAHADSKAKEAESC